MSNELLRRTPLYDAHRALGARMMAFAGWEMPLWFRGILVEHRAVREGAGLFDISHMGRLLVEGPEAPAFLRRMLTRDVLRQEPGRAIYTLLLREDGGILDDLLVYRLPDGAQPDRFLLVTNAARAEADRLWLQEHKPKGNPPEAGGGLGTSGVQIRDRQEETAMLALQGPQSPQYLREVVGQGVAVELKPFRCTEVPFNGATLFIARTGYTGEDGFEIILPASLGPQLWGSLLGLGGPEARAGWASTGGPEVRAGWVPREVQPCGLGARDSLRLEAAFLLYGQDMDATTNPFEAGLAWALDLEDADFIGREALLRAKAQGPQRLLVGLAAQERGILRGGCPVLHRGREVGRTTSGGPAPTLGVSIALAYVPTSLAKPGTELAVDVRGRTVAVRVAPRPFYRRPASR
ncbi:MAG TPA: glycine cleavage system aminomethyltransferase GcvT [Dehalococcoidia bacterium]|nr:glycine cleavage system aminomethyltransferase GcvT [Dehalococcoidia bacterium]